MSILFTVMEEAGSSAEMRIKMEVRVEVRGLSSREELNNSTRRNAE